MCRLHGIFGVHTCVCGSARPCNPKWLKAFILHGTRCTMYVYCNIYLYVYTNVIVIVYDGANVAFVAIWQVIKFPNNIRVYDVMCAVRTHRKCWFFFSISLVKLMILLPYSSSCHLSSQRFKRQREEEKIFIANHLEGKNQLNSPHSF